MKYSQLLSNLCIILTTLSSTFLTQTGIGQTLITNEYWISPSTNTSNLGTLNEPFDGSTETKFDAVMGNLPPNSTAHILTGTYETDGDSAWFIKSGQKILGSGRGITVLQLVNPIGNTFVLADNGEDGLGGGTNEEVADLTVDCNYQGGSYDISGVSLDGPSMTVRNINVIHLAYNNTNANSEAWGILCGGQGELIENCEVSDFLGGINNAISSIVITAYSDVSTGTVSPGSGIIRDNLITYTNFSGACNGIGAGFSNGVLIEGNTENGVGAAIYNDTGNSTNIIIVNNRFENVASGLYFGNGNCIRQNYIFSKNTILLATNVISRAINLGYGCTNWNITGNTVGWYYPPQSGALGYFLVCASQEQGVLVANNRVDASLEESVVTNGYTAYGNYDFTGNWLTNLDQTPF